MTAVLIVALAAEAMPLASCIEKVPPPAPTVYGEVTSPGMSAPPTRTLEPSVIVPPAPELPTIRSTLELLSYGALGVLGVLKKLVAPAVQVPAPSAGGLPPPTDQSRSVPVLVMTRSTPVGVVFR